MTTSTSHISPNAWTEAKRTLQTHDSFFAYIDRGSGAPVVFLHGNPTSSYLWRNIIPLVEKDFRCLAPDLLGMGDSGEAPNRAYRFMDHARYLDAWFEALNLGKVHLVLHDWGSALGFHWARRHPHLVASLTYMEALVQPRRWSDFPPPRQEMFRALRSEAGEQLVLDNNFFVEVVLPKSIVRSLTPEEMDAYRKPFLSRERRMPTLVFPRELPIENDPADVTEAVNAYASWLATNDLPKLLLSASPGALLTGRALDFCRSWKNQREVQIRGVHYVQEDSPQEIGVALLAFLQSLTPKD